MVWLMFIVSQLQMDAGLDIIMADKVGLISKTLKHASI